MSEGRSSGWWWLDPLVWAFPAGVIAVVGVPALVLYCVWNDDGDRCPQGRMSWSCISWVTVDRYERQFREDRPIGTPRQQVEVYLNREGVPFSEKAAVPSGPPILKVDKSFPGFFKSSLSITIVFSATGDVAEILYNKSINAL